MGTVRSRFPCGVWAQLGGTAHLGVAEIEVDGLGVPDVQDPVGLGREPRPHLPGGNGTAVLQQGGTEEEPPVPPHHPATPQNPSQREPKLTCPPVTARCCFSSAMVLGVTT